MSNYGSERPTERDLAYQTGNYPPANDTTSEGGYGSSSNTFSPQSQRHADPSTGLIDQSLDGGPLGRELQDAKQGGDMRAREQFAHEVRRDFAPSSVSVSTQESHGLNPYGRNPDSLGEAGEQLAAGYADQKERRFEGGGAAGIDSDPGMLHRD
ncbi:hypothetical protein C8Q79DRAFT_1007216 [Trametes meyenii]|nr:hypothetical protein C8Q79DRAFT_1007216 [Trametes meyenii]